MGALLRTVLDNRFEDDVRVSSDDLEGVLRQVIAVVASPLVDSAARTLEAGQGAWEPLEDVGPDALWEDLRPSDAIALMTEVKAASDRARDRCREVIVDELLAVAVAFEAAHPDAKIVEVED